MASTAAAAAADEPVAHGIAPPEPEPEEAKVCAWCGATENLKRCGGCRKKWFCDNDKKCLKEAWTTGGHKQECKASQRSKGEGPKTLPAAMKTAPKWVQGPPALPLRQSRFPRPGLRWYVVALLEYPTRERETSGTHEYDRTEYSHNGPATRTGPAGSIGCGGAARCRRHRR